MKKKSTYTTMNIDIETLRRLKRCKGVFGCNYSQMIEIFMASTGLYVLPASIDKEAITRFKRHIEYLKKHGHIKSELEEMLK